MKTKDLFEPIVDRGRLNITFEYMRTSLAAEPARLMANEIFQDFPDTDGNFVEQFQTTGFDSRIFELYLYAYLSRSGYGVNRAHEKPDFIVTKEGVPVAIEATTVNPTQTEGTIDTRGIADLTTEELQEKLENELPIRFGGPLFSKLNKGYWRLEQCRGIPIVLAIEAFQEEGSLYFSHSSLGQYLYGQRHYPDRTEDGHLIVKSTEITNHKWGAKVIPSNFFRQPNTEYISAVVFSNSGTYAKFCRMGYQAGYYRGNTQGIRLGACWNPDPDAATPMKFSYEVDDPPLVESWGQGLVVFHNPYALFRVPRGYFIDAAEMYIKDGQIKSDVPNFFPYMSQTLFVHVERGLFDSSEAGSLPIESLLKYEFDALKPFRHPITAAIGVEKEWFADRRRVILGALVLDRTDQDWGYVVLGRDQRGIFRWIDGEVSLEDRDRARERLVATMARIIESGQTVFPQE
jgi:hypothetical protein